MKVSKNISVSALALTLTLAGFVSYADQTTIVSTWNGPPITMKCEHTLPGGAGLNGWETYDCSGENSMGKQHIVAQGDTSMWYDPDNGWDPFSTAKCAGRAGGWLTVSEDLHDADGVTIHQCTFTYVMSCDSGGDWKNFGGSNKLYSMPVDIASIIHPIVCHDTPAPPPPPPPPPPVTVAVKPAPFAEGYSSPVVLADPNQGGAFFKAGRDAIDKAMAFRGGGAATAALANRGFSNGTGKDGAGVDTRSSANHAEHGGDKINLAGSGTGQTSSTTGAGPGASSGGAGKGLSGFGTGDGNDGNTAESAATAAAAGKSGVATTTGALAGYGSAAGSAGPAQRLGDGSVGDGSGMKVRKIRFGEASGSRAPAAKDGSTGDLSRQTMGAGLANRSLFELIRRGYQRAQHDFAVAP